jgi:hypothetical protein
MLDTAGVLYGATPQATTPTPTVRASSARQGGGWFPWRRP